MIRMGTECKAPVPNPYYRHCKQERASSAGFIVFGSLLPTGQPWATSTGKTDEKDRRKA